MPLREAHPDTVKRIRGLPYVAQPHGYVGTCLAIKVLSTRSALTHIVCPALVIIGGQDTGAPVETTYGIATYIPDTCLKVIPYAVHLVPTEQEEGFLAGLDEFLGHTGYGSQCDTP